MLKGLWKISTLKKIPNSKCTFKLNWASHNLQNRQSTNLNDAFKNKKKYSSDYDIFVGDLSYKAKEEDLLKFFQAKYSSIISVKIIIDPTTQQSKGYGFIKFGEKKEFLSSIIDMNGILFYGKPLKVNAATTKKPLKNDIVLSDNNSEKEPSLNNSLLTSSTNYTSQLSEKLF